MSDFRCDRPNQSFRGCEFSSLELFFFLASTQAHFGVADAVSSRAARAGGEGGARVESAANSCSASWQIVARIKYLNPARSTLRENCGGKRAEATRKP